ncbi:MAG: UDP-N-acetylmuramate dehydrogenase [Burkholderiaceae bacterium]
MGAACRSTTGGVYNSQAMPTDLLIQKNVSLRSFNTFGLNASARAYLRVDDPMLLEQAWSSKLFRAMPVLILGGGSNIVLTRDFDGLVLHMANRGIEVVSLGPEKITVRAAAGESWHLLVEWTLSRGFGGLENLSLIPGSVGAAPIQNIGAYGLEVGTMIDSVRYFDIATGQFLTLSRSACQFGYRDSVFKRRLQGRAVIIDVTFSLPVDWQPNLEYSELRCELDRIGGRKPRDEAGWESMPRPRPCLAASPSSVRTTLAADCPLPDACAVSDAVIAIRTRKLPDPGRLGNAGSFFKNPLVSAEHHAQLAKRWSDLVSFPQPGGGVKLSAGWMIDQCGWKGRSLGPVGVYEKQALVLVNHGGATGADIIRLATAIQSDVLTRFDVMLELEPVVI